MSQNSSQNVGIPSSDVPLRIPSTYGNSNYSTVPLQTQLRLSSMGFRVRKSVNEGFKSHQNELVSDSDGNLVSSGHAHATAVCKPKQMKLENYFGPQR